MKEFLSIKNVVLLIGVVYIIILLERYLKRDDTGYENLIEHQAEKIEMQRKIIALTNKVHDYEKSIIQNSIDIFNMSNSERDSTRNVLNPR
tara:strand:- start:1132 stop:1404 length:273 start_codon:yes stop_codon:yes gene_type:complete